MTYRHEMQAREATIRRRQCPDCAGPLVPSTDVRGCWIPFHVRCPSCALCWREDGSARSCRVSGLRSAP